MSTLYWLIVVPYLVFTGALILMGKDNFIALLFGNKNIADQ
jgi:hypothetical protein